MPFDDEPDNSPSRQNTPDFLDEIPDPAPLPPAPRLKEPVRAPIPPFATTSERSKVMIAYREEIVAYTDAITQREELEAKYKRALENARQRRDERQQEFRRERNELLHAKAEKRRRKREEERRKGKEKEDPDYKESSSDEEEEEVRVRKQPRLEAFKTINQWPCQTCTRHHRRCVQQPKSKGRACEACHRLKTSCSLAKFKPQDEVLERIEHRLEKIERKLNLILQKQENCSCC